MLHFRDTIGRFAIATGYHELTVGRFCALLRLGTSAPLLDVVAALAGRHVVAATDEAADTLTAAVDWLTAAPPTEVGEDTWPYPANLGQETYIQVELLREALARPTADALPTAFGLMCARTLSLRGRSGRFEQARVVTLSAQCLADPLTRVWPAFLHARAEIERLGAKYAELAEPCPCLDCAKVRARGGAALDALRYFNTLEALAAKYGKTVDEVAQWPADTVYLMLVRERRTHTLTVALRPEPATA